MEERYALHGEERRGANSDPLRAATLRHCTICHTEEEAARRLMYLAQSHCSVFCFPRQQNGNLSFGKRQRKAAHQVHVLA